MGDADDFDADSLLAEARRRTGLMDFGDPRFREPMDRLLASLEHEAKLSPTGRAAQRERVVGNLVTRLTAEALVAQHPEILDEKLEAPLVIVGPTRSGTTRLHRMLSVDPRHFTVLWWENRRPVPYPGTDWRRDDPRISEAAEEVAQVLEAAPQMKAIHPWDPNGPDEDAMLCEHAFLSYVSESTVHVPSYRDWMQDTDVTPAYQFLARMLRILQWQKRQRGERGPRWVLKTPQHLGFIETFCRVFPDARIVQTHRDPLSAVPSAASMYSTLWQIGSDEVDLAATGRQCRDRLALDLSRFLTFRSEQPAERFFDVWFDEMERDSVGPIERLYAWLGTPFLPETRRALERWLVENAREKRPPHRYNFETFGLSEDDLVRRFADYRERFILPRRVSGANSDRAMREDRAPWES
jgi:hypothetical protein